VLGDPITVNAFRRLNVRRVLKQDDVVHARHAPVGEEGVVLVHDERALAEVLEHSVNAPTSLLCDECT
jgi:hypothetical protein